jgi:hypothetical protein
VSRGFLQKNTSKMFALVLQCLTMEKSKKSELIAFRSESDIREALEKEALEKDRTMSWLINHYLRKGLEQSGYIPQKSSEK